MDIFISIHFDTSVLNLVKKMYHIWILYNTMQYLTA